MTNVGRALRQKRLMFPGTNSALIVPIDHGITVGPIGGLDTVRSIRTWLGSADFSALLLHKGMLEYLVLHNLLRSSLGIIVHLNGMSNLSDDADTKRMVTTIESALQLGADAVSIQINFSQGNFSHNIEMLGRATDAAHARGLPLLTMLYNKMDSQEENTERTNKLIRIAVELGSDLLKIEMPQHIEHLTSIMGQFLGNTKVVFAGGPAGDAKSLFDNAERVLKHGCNGLCIGRNIFQARNPNEILAGLADIIKSHDGAIHTTKTRDTVAERRSA